MTDNENKTVADVEHETAEQHPFRVAESVEDAHALHHLATADPEPERDGTMTGPAHEEKYDLERAEQSKAEWIAAGVDPIKNVALLDVENADGELADENVDGNAPVERTVAPPTEHA